MEFKKNIDARASENIWFFAKIIMKSIFYEWIEFKYELPSLSPTNRLWLFEFFPPKNERNYSTQMEIQKKTMKLIISPFWLFYRHGYIKQMNWNTFKMTKKCRFYLFDNDRELIGTYLRIYLFQLQNQNEKTPFKINYFEQWYIWQIFNQPFGI